MAGNFFDQFDDKAEPNFFDRFDTPGPDEEQSPFRRVADVGISALKGAIAVPEAVVGLADLATGGEAGKLAEEAGFRPGEAKSWLDTLKSEAQKKADKEVAGAKGFVDTGVAMLKNPSTIGHAIVESAPAMGAGGAVARGVTALAPKVAPFVAGALGEGAVAAGSAAEEMRQQSQDGTLTAGQVGAAIGSGAGTMLFGAVGGRIANRLGIPDVDTLLAGGSVKSVDGVLKRVVAGGITEGVFEELPQSVQEQIWMNAATGKPLLEGVPETAAKGLIVGAAMGGGVAAVIRERQGAVPPPAEDPGLNPDSPEIRAITEAATADEAIAAATRALETPAKGEVPDGPPTAMAAAMQAAFDRAAVPEDTRAELEQSAEELDLPDEPAIDMAEVPAEPTTTPEAPIEATPAAVEPQQVPPTDVITPAAPVPALPGEGTDARPLESAVGPAGGAGAVATVPAVDVGGGAAAVPPGQPAGLDEDAPEGSEDFHTRRGELKTFTSAERAKVYLKNKTNKVPGNYVPRQVKRGEWRLTRPVVVRTEAQKANDARLAADRKNIRPHDSLAKMMGKLGGVSLAELEADGFDPKDAKLVRSGVVGKPAIRTKGGLSIDAMAELLQEHGWDVFDEEGRVDASKLRELIHEAVNGEQYTPEGHEYWAGRQAEQQAAQLAAQGMPDEAELEESGYNALTEEEQDAIAEFLESAEDVKWADEAGEATDFTEANAIARSAQEDEDGQDAAGGPEDGQGARGAAVRGVGQEVQRDPEPEGEGGGAQAARAEARGEVVDAAAPAEQDQGSRGRPPTDPSDSDQAQTTPSPEGVSVSGDDTPSFIARMGAAQRSTFAVDEAIARRATAGSWKIKAPGEADANDLTPESAHRQLALFDEGVNRLNGQLVGRARGASPTALINTWADQGSLRVAMNESRKNDPEMWADYEARQKQVQALNVGDAVLLPFITPEHPRGIPGTIVRKFPKNWRVESDGGEALYPPSSLAPAQPPEPADKPALELKGETEAEIRAREAREAKDREAKAKMDAAPPPSDFVLTGSNSKADQARARGQMELGAAPEPKAEEPPAKAAPTIADIPPGLLKKITVTVEQFHEGDGVKSVQVSADKALADTRAEIEAYEALLECVRAA